MCAYGRSGESRRRERRVGRLPNLLQYYCLLLGTVPCEYSNFTVPVTLRIFFFALRVSLSEDGRR